MRRVVTFLLRPSVLYLVLVCGWSAVVIAQWPIVRSDTDLWYHLTGGRYLFEHGAIPRHSFFSFISPPREWVDYFWLFQALAYLLYSWGQYYGLIAFRTAVYLATVVCVVGLLFDVKRDRPPPPWAAFVAVVVCLVLMPRALAIRPHLLTYLLIAVFLYVLECRPRRAIVLPALAVLWCNLHGIAYPVMLLICYAYGLEELLSRWRLKTADRRRGPSLMRTAVLSTGAVLLTPHGTRLLGIPLTSTAAASQYIQELKPVTIFDTLSFEIPLMTPSFATLFNLLVLVVCVAGILALVKRRLRVSHLLLCLGGFVLLAKGVRFRSEFALLALPLLKAAPLFPTAGLTRRLPKPVYLIGLGVLLLFPMRLLVSQSVNRPAYPFSHRGLPQGVAAFLEEVGVGGSVLNHPNSGGYLQWRLYPTYTIFMDMEVPFLFRDEDIYLAVNAFADKAVHQELISTYRPSFITVPNTFTDAPALMAAFPEYVVVFFDDAEVLYVDRRQHPALAEREALTALDPFQLVQRGAESLLHDAADKTALLRSVRRLLEVDPDSQMTNQLVGLAYNAEGAYDRALPHAAAVVRRFPESPAGYRLLGDAWSGLGAFDRAIAAYREGFARSDLPDRVKLQKAIGLAYLKRGEYQQAYRTLQAGINLFSTGTSHEDLFHLWVSARRAGKTSRAEAVLAYLEHKLPKDDPEWRENIRRELAQ
jgi:tetratricopeptide (TPR) repeat protein